MITTLLDYMQTAIRLVLLIDSAAVCRKPNSPSNSFELKSISSATTVFCSYRQQFPDMCDVTVAILQN